MRAKWATRNHMEWLGNAHLVAGAGGLHVSNGVYRCLILNADRLSPTLQGDGPWATEWEIRQLAHDASCDLVVFLWDRHGQAAYNAEQRLRSLGYDDLAADILGGWMLAQPGTPSWAEAHLESQQKVAATFESGEATCT